MPYIVTIKDRYPSQVDSSAPFGPIRSRRAVATLDEAKVAAAEAVLEHIGYEWYLGDRRRPLSLPDRIAECHTNLTEQGGAIEPLPDGTVIEVKHVGYPYLLAQIEQDDSPGNPAKDDEIYNSPGS